MGWAVLMLVESWVLATPLLLRQVWLSRWLLAAAGSSNWRWVDVWAKLAVALSLLLWAVGWVWQLHWRHV